MKRTLLYTLFLLFTFSLYSQPTIQWQKSIGGTKNDFGRKIIKTSDGGYISAGYTMSNDKDIINNHGNTDIIVIKLSSTGTIQWQKTYGGSNSDTASAIQQTLDGGYIIAGTTSSNDGDVTGYKGGYSDYWIIKISNDGTIEWQKCFGGTNTDSGSDVQQTADGGYIVCGSASSNDGDVSGNHMGNGASTDYWVVKLTNTGSIMWQKCYGSNYEEILHSIKLTSDGGFILNGETSGNGGDVTGFKGEVDYWVVKINSSGVLEWQKALGGSKSDYGVDIIQNSKGNYIAVGYIASTDRDVTNSYDNGDAWIVELSSTGNIIWQKSIGGTGSDYLYSVNQTTDGGYILAGDTSSNDFDATGHHGTSFNFDFWIVKLSNNGNVEWSKSLGGSATDTASMVNETSSGNYIAAGYSYSSDGDLTINNGESDIWIVNLGNNLSIPNRNTNPVLSFFPNPTKEFINLHVDPSLMGAFYKIYDQSSKLVKTDTIQTENSTIQINNLPNGIYYIKVLDSTFKIIKN
ncbi:T9SS type A sorting domain-containing protein [Flavobacterium sp. KACC 22763]|uniref:T9SS type A sorting domain-containing protein n=1 Tax=Flavobacterium sp. KACC 22763 TaxID=3025668 RepID=UPI0023656DE8|nr:T9SS type A sorting domain-containing protein [Flavobacterium sp. KACC 22763]WDF64300.1 T9SS type A sorting domain-containing protein [Flavobacterium sp. KACC 22763]